MKRKRKPYKTFTREFKLEAVRLMETSELPSSEVARELSVRRNQLAQKGDHAFSGQGHSTKEKQSKLTNLKKENMRLKEEIETLKQAAAYFARELK